MDCLHELRTCSVHFPSVLKEEAENASMGDASDVSPTLAKKRKKKAHRTNCKEPRYRYLGDGRTSLRVGVILALGKLTRPHSAKGKNTEPLRVREPPLQLPDNLWDVYRLRLKITLRTIYAGGRMLERVSHLRHERRLNDEALVPRPFGVKRGVQRGFGSTTTRTKKTSRARDSFLRPT